VHLGLRLPSNGPNADAEHILRTGRLAEELGFDSLWCNDHIIMPPDTELTPTYGRLFEDTCLAFKQPVGKCSPRFRLRIGQGG
jgi:alkanesulfonate monooxygenase SsuD/methylene tetrahydromethanopterin reductase-like flavin-dependent oxidoreductase (luciferase family)